MNNYEIKFLTVKRDFITGEKLAKNIKAAKALAIDMRSAYHCSTGIRVVSFPIVKRLYKTA